jgi:CTP:phosphocholine cytidylyltransferase-like protein
LVRPNGILAIMTLFINAKIDYKSWWYKNDPTHVVFYHEDTFVYLANRFGLEIIFNDKVSIIIFRKK